MALSPDEIVRTIDGCLYQLGWARTHPRVTSFVAEIAKRHTLLDPSLEKLPVKYLIRLAEFLKIYEHCQQLLKILKLDWESPIIKELTADYGGVDKMPIIGWRHLYESLEHQYFLVDMPTPSDAKPPKTKKKATSTKAQMPSTRRQRSPS